METTEQTAIFEQYLYRRYGDRSTPKHYLSDLRIFLAYLGAKPLQQVTVADIDAFIDAGHSQSLAATTINRRLATLHTFFECLAAQAPNEAWPNPLPKHLSAAEYERLTTTVFAATTQTTLPALAARAWFLTLAHTGMRLNELLDLRISDVDFANGRILICNPKRGRDRIAYLTPSLAQYLQTYLRQRPDVADDHVWFYDGKLLADEAVPEVA